MPMDRDLILASGYFDADWYLRRYADVAPLALDPLDHYLRIGARLLRDPGPRFSTRAYLDLHEDVRAAGVNPLIHYLKAGEREGREIQAAGRSALERAEDDLRTLLNTPLVGAPARVFKQRGQAREERFLSNAALAWLRRRDSIGALSVTVVMPSYNRADRLRAAIESVVAQTHVNWELIVVDDGSTDPTPQVVDAFAADTRIRRIPGAHRGVSAARNAGLTQARGEYIFYLDSDNRWDPGFLRLMLTSMQVTGARCAYSAILLEDDDGKVLAYRGEPFDWNACLSGNYVDLNAFGHHRSLYEAHGGFDERLRRMVDWDLILRYTRETRPVYAPFVGCLYRESRGDAGRITTSEPLLYLKVVQMKNRLRTDDLTQVASQLKLSIAIKIPAHYEEREQWGDFHYADSLKTALEALGHAVHIDFLGRWYERSPMHEDVVIVLRGLSAYKPRPGQLSILWNISHPDQVSYEEYEQYTYVYVASTSYTTLLHEIVRCPVRTLLQCTDVQRFPYRGDTRERSDRLLFVGNSRNEFRPIVRRAIEEGAELDVHGTRWESYIEARHLRSQNLPNRELGAHYAAARAVLNDHWESMQAFGFVSNRVFDVLACGGTLISDEVPTIGTLFGDAVAQIDPQARGGEGLPAIADRLHARGDRKSIAAMVHGQHSFDHRARTIVDDVMQHLSLRPPTASALPTLTGHGRRRVSVLLPRERGRPTAAGFVRLLSPLSGEWPLARLDIRWCHALDDDGLHAAETLVLPSTAILAPDVLAALRDWKGGRGRTLVVDHAPGLDAAAQDAAQPSTLFALADELWTCGTTGLDATLPATLRRRSAPTVLDPRIWRNYRLRPGAREPGAPMQLLFFQDLAPKGTLQDLLLPALDVLQTRQRDRFRLTVTGAVPPAHMRDWLRPIDALACSDYPRLARWLRQQSPFDLGLVPGAPSTVDDGPAELAILQHAALGATSLIGTGRSAPAGAPDGLCMVVAGDAAAWTEALVAALAQADALRERGLAAMDWLWLARSSTAAGRERAAWLAA